MSLKFLDGPPPRSTPRTDWRRVARDLRANPGRWAELMRVPVAERGRTQTPYAQLRKYGVTVIARRQGDEVVSYAVFEPKGDLPVRVPPSEGASPS